jgi:hypothetical protein
MNERALVLAQLNLSLDGKSVQGCPVSERCAATASVDRRLPDERLEATPNRKTCQHRW